MRGSLRCSRPTTKAALWPPKPKLLLMARPALRLARLVGHVVEIAVRVGCVVVDRRRHHAVADRQDEKINSTPPLAPSRWPELALGAGDAQLSGVFAEDCLMAFVSAASPRWRAGAVGVDVPIASAGIDGASFRARSMALAAPVPCSSGCGDVAAVGTRAVAEQLGVDPRTAAPGVLQFFDHQQAGPFAEHEAVAVPVERPAGAGGSSLRSDRARMLEKPAMPIGVIAASVPPVTMTSASSCWMALKASPMALAALAQAVATAVFGPRRPYWIETCPLAALTISLGIVKAETLSGPFVQISRECCASISFSPPMPEPRMTPAAEGIFLGEIQARIAHRVDAGHQGELREAVEPLFVLGRDIVAGRPIVDVAGEIDFVLQWCRKA